MNLSQNILGTVSVGTAAVQLGGGAAYTRYLLDIYNAGAASIYLGTANTVTTSTGFPVPASTLYHWLGPAAVWAISSGTCTVNVLEVLA